MDKAQLKRALLSVINRYLHGTPLCDCEDWKTIYDLAKLHSLIGVFYLATKGTSLPEEVLRQAKDDFEVEVMQQTLQDYYAQVLFARFDEEGVAYMPMKGYHTRKLYPQPEARSSCDLDVFYDEKDKEKVEVIFMTEGFAFVIENATHQEWHKDSSIVEMHYALVGQVPAFDEYYRGVWDRLVHVGGKQYGFTTEDEYIYFLVHAAKHFMNGGVGVRTVLDVYFYVKTLSFNEQCLQTELQKLGLEQFAFQLQNLASVWFEAGKENEDTELLGDFVFSSGTYGTRQNLAASVETSSVQKAKRKRLWLSIFPRYRDMKSWYPVVKKCPPLLPFVWVYRWFEVLFTRRGSFKKVARDVKGIDERRLNSIKKIKEMTGLPF